jgi:hypothetical protein
MPGLSARRLHHLAFDRGNGNAALIQIKEPID